MNYGSYYFTVTPFVFDILKHQLKRESETNHNNQARSLANRTFDVVIEQRNIEFPSNELRLES